MDIKDRKICVIGTWHQGAVGAACLADMGYRVVGADPSEENVARLSSAKAALFEPGLDELLKAGLDSGRLSFSSDLSASVLRATEVFVMFDTPVDENDQSDLTCIYDAIDAVAPCLEQRVVIYVTAQVPVGTCDHLKERITEKRPDLEFGLVYSPENLRLGQAINLYRKPALPVMGSNESWALDRLEHVFEPLGVEWHRLNLRSAEMTKHALNAFLAAQITFGNELGNLCDEVGADGVSIAKVLRLEPRIGDKAMLLPGLAFSGGTIARDMQTLRGLGDRHGYETRMLDGIWDANQKQNALVLRKLQKLFGDTKGAEVAVLGLTYKPGTSTLRRSASLEIIDELAEAGIVVKAHDPKADRKELKQYDTFDFFEDVYEAVKGTRAVVLITGWPEYKELDFQRVKDLLAEPTIIDTQNMLNGDALISMGYKYLDIGRGRLA